MKIKEIDNKEVWEKFFLECKEKTFLQSWNWGEFHKMMGNKIWRLGIFDDKKDSGELSFVALIVKIVAKRGVFLVVQHLIPNQSKFKILEILLTELKRIGKKEKCNFIRIASLWNKNEENIKIFKKLGFREAPMHINAYEGTINLDIKPLEEELLKNMRKTTRYLIRQAQINKDIEIFQSQKIEDVEIFEKLQQKVVKKQNFVPFSLEYLKNEFKIFEKDKQVSLFFGKYKGKIVAGIFVVFWSKIGFYHYAALLPEYRKIPINYLLQWEAIKEAKKRKCYLYDFWGYVNPQTEPKHPWAGPTLFKLGFGGQPCQYVKTQDLPLSWKYWLTYIFEKIRKTKRGL